MITPIEIAKILLEQKKNRDKKKTGFDTAILGLGIHLTEKKVKAS